MVLAAGIGKRMRPLTVSRPKPLVRVAGKALIDHALDKLSEAGVTRAVVNAHYLADQLEAHVLMREAPAIAVSDEREALLETGGGLVKALPLIDRETFSASTATISGSTGRAMSLPLCPMPGTRRGWTRFC
jgi:MurNAc alpha-1-phosphate uridylyltransferase